LTPSRQQIRLGRKESSALCQLALTTMHLSRFHLWLGPPQAGRHPGLSAWGPETEKRRGRRRRPLRTTPSYLCYILFTIACEQTRFPVLRQRPLSRGCEIVYPPLPHVSRVGQDFSGSFRYRDEGVRRVQLVPTFAVKVPIWGRKAASRRQYWVAAGCPERSPTDNEMTLQDFLYRIPGSPSQSWPTPTARPPLPPPASLQGFRGLPANRTRAEIVGREMEASQCRM